MPPPTSPLITPEAIQKLLMQGGSPSSMFAGDPSQPGAAPTPTTGPPSGTLSQNMPTASPAQPSTPSTPSMTSPPSGTISGAMSPSPAPPSGTLAQSFQAPEDKQQYLSEHPPAMAPRPTTELDNMGTKSKILATLFAGMSEFGRPGAGFNTVNRWNEEQQAQRNYDKNLPAVKQQAENTAYDQYLNQGQKAGEIQKTGAETQNLQQNNPAMARKAQFLSQLQADAESGKYDPVSLKAKYLRMAQFNRVNVAPEEIDSTIQGTKALGSKYTLTRDPQTQAPIELVDRQGNHFSQSNLPNDPEAKQMWNDAATASGQKESVEENKEKRVAGYAADRQASAFANQQTETGRKAAAGSIADINDAKNQQGMIEQLLGGKMNPASQTAAMFKMIGLEQPTGTHRIMPAEIEGIEHMGGLTDKLKQKLLNWKEGDRFSPDLIPDVISTAKILSNNKMKTANDNLESNAKIYGYKAPGANAAGRFDKPEDYQQSQTQQGGQGGAQHTPGGKAQGLKEGATGTGSDGKKYIVKGGVWVSQ